MSREIYFEHQVVGRHAKVTAIDSLTQVEVSVYGPAAANPRDLEALALRKLEARISAAPAPTPPVGSTPGPGSSRLV
jgi:hypothetical protein